MENNTTPTNTLLEADKINLFKTYLVNQKEGEEFLVESWYDKLKGFTAETYFIPLTLDEVNSIIAFYRFNFLSDEKCFNEGNVEILKNFQEKIDKVLNEKEIFKGKYFFGRLSNRSPKDGEPFDKTELKPDYEKYLSKLKSKWKPELWKLNNTNNQINYNINLEDGIEGNFKLVSLFKLSDNTIKCRNSNDIMNLLLTSERVYVDLIRERLVYFGLTDEYYSRILSDNSEDNSSPSILQVKLSLRQWIQMEGKREFRCFVKNNQMTAISQYNHYIIIEDLLDKNYLNSVKTKLFSFWKENIQAILHYLTDYVIDLALLEDESVYVIELNPLLTSTGSGLFCWKRDENILKREIIDGGADDVVIRARNELYPNIAEFAEVMLEDLYSDKKKRNFKEVFDMFQSNKEEKSLSDSKTNCKIF